MAEEHFGRALTLAGDFGMQPLMRIATAAAAYSNHWAASDRRPRSKPQSPSLCTANDQRVDDPDIKRKRFPVQTHHSPRRRVASSLAERTMGSMPETTRDGVEAFDISRKELSL
jgi:hypothetical protein